MESNICNRMLLELFLRCPQEFYGAYLNIFSRQSHKLSITAPPPASCSGAIVHARQTSSSLLGSGQFDVSFQEFTVLLVATAIAEYIQQDQANNIEHEFIGMAAKLNVSPAGSKSEEAKTPSEIDGVRRPSKGLTSADGSVQPPERVFGIDRASFRSGSSIHNLKLRSKRRSSSWSKNDQYQQNNNSLRWTKAPSFLRHFSSFYDEDENTIWYDSVGEDIIEAMEDKIDELERELMLAKTQYRKQKQTNKELSELYLTQSQELKALEREHAILKSNYAEAMSKLDSRSYDFESMLNDKEVKLHAIEEENDELQANLLRSIEEKNAMTLEMAELEESIGRNVNRSKLMTSGLESKQHKATRHLHPNEKGTKKKGHRRFLSF